MDELRRLDAPAVAHGRVVEYRAEDGGVDAERLLQRLVREADLSPDDAVAVLHLVYEDVRRDGVRVLGT